MAETKPQIVMRSGPIPGSSYYLDKPEVSMGRDLANDIPVPDAEISRRHARFIVKPDGVYIEDLGSTNGTFLNGVRLSAPKRLSNGDLVTLAESTVMSFEWEDAQQAAAYTPTYGAPATQPEPVQPKREPVYQNVAAPTPQRPLAPEPTPVRKTKKPWYLNFLVILLVILIIIGLVLTFMPASWWCFLSFNRLPGCY
ncbi:MAG: FHA domain-containing protein [Chloroflexi bacterium]|jgi:hypothetical protein|nr:FHA domain-containing protein [Chloroflexota bacterium]